MKEVDDFFSRNLTNYYEDTELRELINNLRINNFNIHEEDNSLLKY